MISMKSIALAGILAFFGGATVASECPTPRMPLSESASIKRSMLPFGTSMADFELDHIVPLCLCGSNDRSNLQLQPWPEAHAKDHLEWSLCRAVRNGEMPREEAVKIMREWRP